MGDLHVMSHPRLSLNSVRAPLGLLLLGSVASAAPSFDGVVRAQPDGSYAAYMIPPYQSNHASSIEVLPDGTLAAAWFSGAKEEAPGCAIVVATLPARSSQWSAAKTVSKNAKYSNQNPVLFYDNTTQILHLFHSQAPAEVIYAPPVTWVERFCVCCPVR